jgi:hypothetical protein
MAACARRLRSFAGTAAMPREQAAGCRLTFFAFSNEIVTSHPVIFSLGVTYPDPSFEGRIHEAS